MTRLLVRSPDTYSERRYDSETTIGSLKHKLEHVTGIFAASQVLLLQSGASTSGYGASTSSNGIVLSNDSATLAAYGAQDDMTLLVSSSAPGPTAEFSDLSQVDKVVMSDAEYAKRNDTVLAYKQRNKLGRFDESKSIDGSSASSSQQVPPELQAGARCEVSLGGEHKRRGTVRHVGPTQFGAQDGSVWVGVEFDEPVGKGDGSVAGVRYFGPTPPQRASFVKPDSVQVGDYPELNPFDDDELDEM